VAVNSKVDGRSYTVTSNSDGHSLPAWCPTAGIGHQHRC
jgi:hypothetical protein